eukprot:2981756-Pleurochrysis_carterae.AAC.1
MSLFSCCEALWLPPARSAISIAGSTTSRRMSRYVSSIHSACSSSWNALLDSLLTFSHDLRHVMPRTLRRIHARPRWVLHAVLHPALEG